MGISVVVDTENRHALNSSIIVQNRGGIVA